jgi:putative redox protein
MKATVQFDSTLHFTGTTEHGKQVFFDTTIKGGGSDMAPSPMDNVLMAAAACSAMDVVSILQKRRKTVNGLKIELSATRAEAHPRVFTHIEMDFQLVSTDATYEELAHAIELSHSKYCSVSIMLMRSGCEVTWKASVRKP